MNDEPEKGKPISIPLTEDMKKLVWNEYLEGLRYYRVKYPEDFYGVPLEPIMPSDIDEIFRLRNSLYKYMDSCYSDSYW